MAAARVRRGPVRSDVPPGPEFDLIRRVADAGDALRNPAEPLAAQG
ncbi:hypothetical protein [Streptomyces sp. NPDC058299]